MKALPICSFLCLLPAVTHRVNHIRFDDLHRWGLTHVDNSPSLGARGYHSTCPP